VLVLVLVAPQQLGVAVVPVLWLLVQVLKWQLGEIWRKFLAMM
jgi:hypothetical protein